MRPSRHVPELDVGQVTSCKHVVRPTATNVHQSGSPCGSDRSGTSHRRSPARNSDGRRGDLLVSAPVLAGQPDLELVDDRLHAVDALGRRLVRIFSYVRRTDHVFLKLNVLFLTALALLPFPTALAGTYGTTHDERARTALLIYAGSLLITAILFTILWFYATHERRLVDPDLPDDVVEAITASYLVGPIGYAIAFVVAWWSPLAGAIIIILVALFYLLPIHLTTRD